MAVMSGNCRESVMEGGDSGASHDGIGLGGFCSSIDPLGLIRMTGNRGEFFG